MKTVPFNAGWLDNGSLDLLAVYRRPRLHAITKERLSDEQGKPLWDYVNLPIRRHNDWSKKGYQYVTLARVADLISVKQTGPEVLAGYKRNGEPEERTFDVQSFLKFADVAEDAEFEKLKALVAEMGPDAVEKVMRHGDPSFVLPEALRTPPAATIYEHDESKTTTVHAAAPTAAAKPKGKRKPTEPITA